MKLATIFQKSELDKLQYSVLIECWKSIMQSGSKKRRYFELFNEDERAIIAKQYKVFSTWYWKTGTPENHSMPIKTYQLMHEAICFFAMGERRVRDIVIANEPIKDKQFAETSWCWQDVKSIKKEWNQEQCESFLADFQSKIVDAMIDAGWYAMRVAIEEIDMEV